MPMKLVEKFCPNCVRTSLHRPTGNTKMQYYRCITCYKMNKNAAVPKEINGEKIK